MKRFLTLVALTFLLSTGAVFTLPSAVSVAMADGGGE